MIRIKAFRAIDNLKDCVKFSEGHRKVLQFYGVTQVTSANLDWMNDPLVYVIIAQSFSGEVLGGARVHVFGEDNSLPIEKAVCEIDRGIHNKVKAYALNRTGEICGLWNSKEVAGMGIGTLFLMRAGISITSQIKLGSLFALCAEHTLAISTSKGFEIEKSLGNNGTFYYPKQNLVATALLMKDPNLLSNAEPKERDIIFDLRKNPQQVRDRHRSEKSAASIYQ